MSQVKEIKSLEEYKQVLEEDTQNKGVSIIDCYAEWCGPCKVISPKVEAFSQQYTSARFFKVDVDKVPDVAQELGIRAMPTFKFFKAGEPLESVVGANPAGIEAAIQAALA